MSSNLDNILIEGERISDLTEAQIRNRKRWDGRLLIKHPFIAVGILLGMLSIAVSSSIYGLTKVVEYLNKPKTEQIENYKSNTNYLPK